MAQVFKRSLLAVVASGCLGACIGIFVVYRFYVGYVDGMLNLRFSTELAQDIATYRSMQQGDMDKASRLLRARMVGDAVGLKGQCDRLKPEQKKRAEELFKSMKDIGVDASAIPGAAQLGVSLDSCSGTPST